eukprot:SAG22_NODE_2167_length_2905_cov_1.403778_3_plen_169_part_00
MITTTYPRRQGSPTPRERGGAARRGIDSLVFLFVVRQCHAVDPVAVSGAAWLSGRNALAAEATYTLFRGGRLAGAGTHTGPGSCSLPAPIMQVAQQILPYVGTARYISIREPPGGSSCKLRCRTPPSCPHPAPATLVASGGRVGEATFAGRHPQNPKQRQPCRAAKRL